MKIILISQYSTELINNTEPENSLLVRHFNLYHKKVYQTLIDLKHTVLVCSGNEDNIEELIKNSDAVFPIKHDYGYIAGDYRIILLCQKNRVKYIGCSTSSKLYDTDKVAGKLLVNKLGIKSPEFLFIYNLKEAKIKKGAYLIKPRFAASSKDLDDTRICYNKQELIEKTNIIEAKECYFIEKYISGLTVSIGCVISADKEFLFSDAFSLESKTHKVITFEDKKAGGCIVKTIKDEKVLNKLKEFAKNIFQAIQPCVMARFDFILSKSNHMFFLEINTTPTLNPENTFVKSLVDKYFGNYEMFLSHLLNVAISSNK